MSLISYNPISNIYGGNNNNNGSGSNNCFSRFSELQAYDAQHENAPLQSKTVLLNRAFSSAVLDLYSKLNSMTTERRESFFATFLQCANVKDANNVKNVNSIRDHLKSKSEFLMACTEMEKHFETNGKMTVALASLATIFVDQLDSAVQKNRMLNARRALIGSNIVLIGNMR